MPFRFSFFSKSRQTTAEKKLEINLVDRIKKNIQRTNMPAKGIKNFLLKITNNISESKSQDELNFYHQLLSKILPELTISNSGDILNVDNFTQGLEAILKKLLKKEITIKKFHQLKEIILDKYIKELEDNIKEFEQQEEFFGSQMMGFDKNKNPAGFIKLQNNYKTFYHATNKALKIKNQVISIKNSRVSLASSRELRINMTADIRKLRAMAMGEEQSILSEYKNHDVNNFSIKQALEDLNKLFELKIKNLDPLNSKRANYELLIMFILSLAGVTSGLNFKADTIFSALESGAALESVGKDIHEGAFTDYIKNNPVDFTLKLLSLISLPLFFITLPPAALISLQGLGVFGSCRDIRDVVKEISWCQRFDKVDTATENMDIFLNKLRQAKVSKLEDKDHLLKLREQLLKLPKIHGELRLIGQEIQHRKLDQDISRAKIFAAENLRPR